MSNVATTPRNGYSARRPLRLSALSPTRFVQALVDAERDDLWIILPSSHDFTGFSLKADAGRRNRIIWLGRTAPQIVHCGNALLLSSLVTSNLIAWRAQALQRRGALPVDANFLTELDRVLRIW